MAVFSRIVHASTSAIISSWTVRMDCECVTEHEGLLWKRDFVRWAYASLAAMALVGMFVKVPLSVTLALFLASMAAHSVAVSLVRHLESSGCSCSGGGGIRMAVAKLWPPLMLTLNVAALVMTMVAASAAAGCLVGSTAGSVAGSMAGSAVGSALGPAITTIVGNSFRHAASKAAGAAASKAAGAAASKAVKAAASKAVKAAASKAVKAAASKAVGA